MELLVGMALIGIVMAAVFSFFSQGTGVAAQSTGRADLQQEVLNTQQMIAGKLREAWYVYPVSATTSITLGSSSLTKNPIDASQNWKVGTHPILAMILPPQTPGGTYRFLAYYAVLRSDWVAGAAGTDWRNPGDDTVNANTWVIAEYRADMPGSFAPTSYPPASAPAVPTTGTANILSDYVAPTNAAGAPYTMFSFTPNSGATVTGVTLNLATTKTVSGKTLRLPGATTQYQISVFPSNLGKIGVQ